MDKTVLVETDLDHGREFIELLESENIQVDAALWQRSETFDLLELVIVTPEVERLGGTRGVYSRMASILASASDPPRINLRDVSVMTSESAFFKSLRGEMQGVRERAVSRQPVGNHVLDDGFIYFVR